MEPQKWVKQKYRLRHIQTEQNETHSKRPESKRQTKMWARRQRGDRDMERDPGNGARRDKGTKTEPSRG